MKDFEKDYPDHTEAMGMSTAMSRSATPPTTATSTR